MLHLVNKYQALLKHLSTLPHVHPELFFRYLLSLATDLMVEDIHACYEHNDMYKGLTELHQRLISFIEQYLNNTESLILTLFGKPYTRVAQFRSAKKLAITPNDRLILEIEQHLKVIIVAPDHLIQNFYLGGFEGSHIVNLLLTNINKV